MKIMLSRKDERKDSRKSSEPNAGSIEIPSGSMSIKLIAVRRTGSKEGRDFMKKVAYELLEVLQKNGRVEETP